MMAYRLLSVLRGGSRCNYAVAGLAPITRTSFRRVSTGGGVLERATNMIKNDPFVKLSLSLCALIVGGTLVMEMYNRVRKNSSPALSMLPPGFTHHSIKRKSQLQDLQSKVQKHSSKQAPPVFYITGPPGSGKTELVRQLCQEYTSKKWLGLRSVPALVVSISATSKELLHISLGEVTNQLGLQPSVDTLTTFSKILSWLSSSRLPWLLVIDDLTESTQPSLDALLKECIPDMVFSQCPGAVLITTCLPVSPSSPQHFHLEQRLQVEEGLELLEAMSGLPSLNQNPSAINLLQGIEYHPMAVALAGATIGIYSSFKDGGMADVIKTYHDLLLTQSSNEKCESLGAAVALYCEAAASDARLRHTFDLLGSCDPEYPLPVGVIAHHLTSELYAIADEALAPPQLDPILAKLKASVKVNNSYWTQLKSSIPFLQPDGPSDESISKVLAASQDEVSYIRDSPILLFRSVHGSGGDLEIVSVHSVAAQQISRLFADQTIPRLNQDHLTKEAKAFESTWLKNFRNFNEEQSMQVFHQKLPGVSSPGVLTKAQFQNCPPLSLQATGTRIPDPLSYDQYLHIVSHYHRVMASLNSYLQWCKGEVEGILMQESLSPHFHAMKSFPLVSMADQVSAEISLLAIQTLSSSPEDRRVFIKDYERLISEQKRLLGAGNSAVAASMVDLASLHLSLNETLPAIEILQSALALYKKLPSHLVQGQLALDMSYSMSSLGLAYNQLGKQSESKTMYEQALATAQSVPPSGKVSTRQRRLVASLLVDVTHAYLALGDLAVAKKYCEIALMMLQTVYPQGHAETVRLFNISSIANALLGNREESTRLRTEASKMKAKLTPQLHSISE